MRKLSIFLIPIIFFCSCTQREAAWEAFYRQEEKLSALEAALIYANSQVTVIYNIAKTLSSESGDFIEKLDTLSGDGIRITFHSGSSIIIENGADGTDNYEKGSQGESGYVPALGIKQDGGRDWYWTADGEFITDTDGSRFRAHPVDGSYGTQPELVIEDGNWYFKYTDQSENPHSVLIGPSSSSEQRYFIKSFKMSDDGKYVCLTFADGTELNVPTYNSSEAASLLCDEINMNMASFRTAVLHQKAGDYVAGTVQILDGTGDCGCELTFRDGSSARLKKALYMASSIKAPFISAVTDGGEWWWSVNGTRSTVVSDELPLVSVKDSLQKVYWHVSGVGEVGADTPFTAAVVNDIIFDSKHITLTVAGTDSTVVLDRASLDEVTDISIVPDTGAGAVSVSSGTNYVKLLVKPSSAAGAISQSESSKFILDVGYFSSRSKADTASISLTYCSSDLDEGTVTFSFGGRKIDVSFFSGMIDANASFRLIDGQRVLSSKYITLKSDDSFTDLSGDGTANCYIIADAGIYQFDARWKGDSKSQTVGDAASAEVLWESFGTDVVPAVGSIVEQLSWENGYVTLRTPDELKDGNAVVAVKDASGKILWSWHIWVCRDFDPVRTAQVYNNNAGTMMDRNLGATSATLGDVHALGLLYQWGRKDPFLSGKDITSSSEAASTISWPGTVASDAEKGTIEFAVANPTTFISYNNENYDWYYTGSKETDDTRWQTSDKDKGLYDPCPTGWRVPDGGNNGVWAKAFGSSESFENGPYDDTNKGMNFGSGNGKGSSMQLGSATVIWYPDAGFRGCGDGPLYDVGYGGRYWSCATGGYDACYLYFVGSYIIPSYYRPDRAAGHSVRCISDKGLFTPFVDLGLSVKWATFNIGASSPEEEGTYFAWGDVTGQTWSGNDWSGDGFSTNPAYKLDSNNNLMSEYDAAHVNLGGSWRMPTKAEQQELIDNCTSTWTNDYNGTKVAGRIFTSKKEGYTDKSIFFPAAGYGDRSLKNQADRCAYYWSSTFDNNGDACYISCFLEYDPLVKCFARNYGLPIRPVKE